MFARTLLRPLRQARNYGGHGGASKFIEPHMNELPVPCGSWQEAHNARQRKYNMTLVGGILFAVTNVYIAKATGCLYLNFYPPDSIE